MLAIVKKVNSHRKREFSVHSAVGHIVTVGTEEKEFLEEREYIGEICIDEYRGNLLYAGRAEVGHYNNRMEFEMVKPEKWRGRVGKIRIGRCFGKQGEEKYTLEEKLQERGPFWIFESGYIFYEICDKESGQKYIVKDICFGADMHYYYIYDQQEVLVSVVYKPYQKPGDDEYHVYTKKDEIADAIFFLISYIDFFYYPYDPSVMNFVDDWETFYDMYNDTSAYSVSCDELLKLYDADFTKEVIINA